MLIKKESLNKRKSLLIAGAVVHVSMITPSLAIKNIQWQPTTCRRRHGRPRFLIGPSISGLYSVCGYASLSTNNGPYSSTCLDRLLFYSIWSNGPHILSFPSTQKSQPLPCLTPLPNFPACCHRSTFPAVFSSQFVTLSSISSLSLALVLSFLELNSLFRCLNLSTVKP